MYCSCWGWWGLIHQLWVKLAVPLGWEGNSVSLTVSTQGAWSRRFQVLQFQKTPFWVFYGVPHALQFTQHYLIFHKWPIWRLRCFFIHECSHLCYQLCDCSNYLVKFRLFFCFILQKNTCWRDVKIGPHKEKNEKSDFCLTHSKSETNIPNRENPLRGAAGTAWPGTSWGNWTEKKGTEKPVWQKKCDFSF